MTPATTCRWCSSNNLRKQVTFQAMPLTDEFITYDKLGSEFIGDISIYACEQCGLVQNPKNFSFGRYYEDYNYSSGHSPFVQNFMNELAQFTVAKYSQEFGFEPAKILEVGSGDGEQLLAFHKLGLNVLGVEPSEKLQKEANAAGVETLKEYFDEHTVSSHFKHEQFSITLSSFTLDHIPSPKKFLENIWDISASEALAIFEIHDIEKINSRGEWCLFEHEHMIYTNADFWEDKLKECGFSIICVNPLNEEIVRANSLIIVAKKIPKVISSPRPFDPIGIDIQRIDAVKERLDKFLEDCDTPIMGWGLGGRGVLTTAYLNNSSKIHRFFDTNFAAKGYHLPKTHIPIEPLENLSDFSDSTVLVFSFGYISEITKTLIENGFDKNSIHSLRDFLG